MVLTRRQYKDISRWFPNEIISEIVQAAPQADRAALCRVSRLFHSVSVPVLYRVVDVPAGAHHRDSMKAFSFAILSNPLLPGLVRSFSATGDRSQWSDDTAFVAQILAALERLLRLEHLSLTDLIIRKEHRDSFLQFSFPCLVSCDLAFSIGGGYVFPLVSSFAQHHPSLRSLSSSLSGEVDSEPSLPLSLPHLRRLSCPICLVSLITDAPDLREVKLRWPYWGAQAVEKTIRTLKSMIRDETAFVCSNDECDGIYAEVLASISRHLPRTKTLRMRMREFESWTGLPDHLLQKKLEHLRNHLPHFTDLRFRSSTMHPINPLQAYPCMVKDIGNVCPSLEACCFNQCAWRRVNQTWEQLPYEDFLCMAGISFP
ncbi:hypothetical protein DFH06DRAFT_1232400 [Mycena polygramma]|nr:hypothetical protein DFH06DRAFT_1232400 [Mycena polygramma]